MLVVTRKVGESVYFLADEGDFKVTVIEFLSGGQVRLGFDAPDEVEILREEVYNEVLDEMNEGRNGESGTAG
jgi:carbon storage regulator